MCRNHVVFVHPGRIFIYFKAECWGSGFQGSSSEGRVTKIKEEVQRTHFSLESLASDIGDPHSKLYVLYDLCLIWGTEWPKRGTSERSTCSLFRRSLYQPPGTV